MHIDRLETPALIVEEKILRQNRETMKALLKDSPLQLRPHYKTHKCAALAHMQMKDGAKGMTCAKLGEALDLADSGIEDILIANQITDPKKIRRMAELAGDCRLTVCVDHAENIDAIAKAAADHGTTIHCLIEFDLGMERCGVSDPKEFLALAERIGSHSHLHFEGIQAYAGHISHLTDAQQMKTLTAEYSATLRSLMVQLNAHGMPAATLSGGSTGTSVLKAAEGLYTELQAGSYLFMDSTYRELELPFRNSLFLLSTVVSRRDGLTVVDAGVKTCGVEQGMPVPIGGSVDHIVDSEEHFQLHGYTGSEKPGEHILLIPGHCCSTINLHENLYIVDDGKVIDRLPITGRCIGK